MKLKLHAGGNLFRTDWVYDEEKGEGGNVISAVPQGEESAYLFDPVELADDLTLRDIFILLKRSQLLPLIYRRQWAPEFLAEYDRVLPTAQPYTGEYDPKGIEYLELYWQWDKNSSTGVVEGSTRPYFHGVGFELREDQMQDDYVTWHKGQRIQWSISFSPLGELINLPLRLDPAVMLCEDDSESSNFMGSIDEKMIIDKPMLGQIIDGILWELSFHGSPEDNRAAKAELDERIAEVKDSFNGQPIDDAQGIQDE